MKGSKIYICALNVRTLSSDVRLTELKEALKTIEWEILGLSEIRRTGKAIIEYEELTFFHTNSV